MKLLRFGANGNEKPGAMDEEGIIRDISAHVKDISCVNLDDKGLQALNTVNLSECPVVDPGTRLGQPVSDVRKVVCIGLNYSDHAKEAGMDIPAEPVLFMKADTALSGPNDNVVIPHRSTKLDWEVELGIVIGKTARYVDEANAMDYIAGFCVVNDVSERAFQIEGTGQWVKGKSHDSFCPFGPYLTTKDEIADVQSLDLWLDIDGKRVQSGNTNTMIFSVAHIVSYVSQHMTLRAGDLIPTGTPPGVGMGLKPQRWLKAGEVMTVGIAGLGEIQQKVVTMDEYTA